MGSCWHASRLGGLGLMTTIIGRRQKTENRAGKRDFISSFTSAMWSSQTIPKEGHHVSEVWHLVLKIIFLHPIRNLYMQKIKSRTSSRISQHTNKQIKEDKTETKHSTLFNINRKCIKLIVNVVWLDPDLNDHWTIERIIKYSLDTNNSWLLGSRIRPRGSTGMPPKRMQGTSIINHGAL